MNDTPADSLTPRLAELMRDVMARRGSWVAGANPLLPAVALWRAATPERSRVQRRAAFLLELVGLARIEIGPGWSLAGEHLPCNVQCGQRVPSAAEAAPHLAELGLTPADLDAIRVAV